MKHALFLLLCLPLWAPAQTERGAAPLTSRPSPRTAGMTRAVVIGISNYQSPQIQDLRFADRDAEAFAEWLQSPAGGGVPKENIRLLTNQQATNARIGAELDWLVEISEEGDNAIIYFSGHGDVETKTFSQFGFLLAHDSPPTNYKVGAYAIVYLQDMVSTLTNLKKARATVITDACHSGKLAGSSIGGTQATAQSLAKQFAGELKIMSCQPNEFSLEGEQWGGGRGAFSYHLVDGLTGLADRNADAQVSLFEISRYLQDKVQEETEAAQLPMIAGDPKGILARVDAPSLEKLLAFKKIESSTLSQVATKGMVEQQVLTQADSTSQELYRQFLAALDSRNLLTPVGHCADDLYRQLINREDLKPLHSAMRRNFAVALQDEVQQALNALLETDPEEVTAWNTDPGKYEHYPAYLQRALELLGEKHYLHHSLLSKKLYFEAHLLKARFYDKETDRQVRDSLRQVVKNILLGAIQLEGNAAYLYYAVGSLYFGNNPYRTDSMKVWDRKALDLSPNWLLPTLDIAYEYQFTQGDVASAEKWMDRALTLAPESYFVLERTAWLRQWQGRLDEAVGLCHRMIALKPMLYSGYATLGRTFWIRTEPLPALEWALKSLDYSRNSWAHQDIICAYAFTRRPDLAVNHALSLESEKGLDKMIRLEAYAYLAWYLVESRKYEEAELFIRRVEASDPRPFQKVIVRSAKAKIAWHRGEWEQASQGFESALTLDPVPNAYYAEIYAWLGKLQAEKDRAKQADSLFQKGIRCSIGIFMDDHEPQTEAHYRYGLFLLQQNRLAEAKQQFEKANEWCSQRGWKGWHGLALLAARQGERDQALDFLEKSLDYYYPSAQPILKEPLFKKLRKTKRFKALLTKYFPETSKQ